MFELNYSWKYKESPGPQVTAYTTTYNCLLGNYPVKDSIDSWSWADKIVVVDGGSTDGTRQLLAELCEKYKNMVVYDIPIDLKNPGKDGVQKAMALAMVDTPLAIQFDIDELCLGRTAEWRVLLKEIPDQTNILCLPVIEPFGDMQKIRMNKTFTPWKWRIYRTKPEITHGIPVQDRVEKDGLTYSVGGSDGCFPVHVVSGDMIPSKLTKMAQNLTHAKDSGDKEKYKNALNEIFKTETPAVFHLGHVNLHHKIKHYLTNWHQWWCMLYNKDANDPKNNLYFPGILISDVTDEMIDAKVKQLMEETPYVQIDQA